MIQAHVEVLRFVQGVRFPSREQLSYATSGKQPGRAKGGDSKVLSLINLYQLL